MNIEKAIEHLQEKGKVVVDELDIMQIRKLRRELKAEGYDTVFSSGDHDYLVLI